VILLFGCSFTFCFVVVEVEAEVAVVIEEVSAVLRRDLLVPCPFGGLEYCGVGAPLRYQIYTNSLAPTVEGFI
jgi:hypothetical protein